MLLTTIAAFIFVIGLLVLFHELGHFITAKMVGMGVHEFAIGFGPKLISKRYGDTVYSLRAIPLGGFNKIAGMDPDEEQDEKSFSAKPLWARMAVIAAGSFMNFVLPVLLLIIVIASSGVDMPAPQATLGGVFANTPAARSQLAAGDRIMAINGGQVESWDQFVSAIQTSDGKQLVVTYERNGQTGSTDVTPEFDSRTNRWVIGVKSQTVNYRPGPVETINLAVKQTFLTASAMLTGIGQMITGRAPAEVAGPLGVAQMTGQVAQLGFIPLLQFAAFLSINLGLINLLPVPVLDGGHLVTLAVEAVRRKPLSRGQMQFIQTIGLTLLILLMLLATFKDIARFKFFE